MRFLEPNGHILVALQNKRYIVDTGSPISFAYDLNNNFVTIDDVNYPLSHNCMASRDELRLLTNMDIDGIIGLDILSKTNLSIDYLNKTIDFKAHEGKLICSFNSNEGFIVSNDFVINGHKVNRAIIDTGAPVSYVSGKYIGNDKQDDTFTDYSPMFGHISGNYYHVRLNSSIPQNHEYETHRFVGVLPDAASVVCDAIMNLNILSDNRCFSINFERGTISEYEVPRRVREKGINE